MQLNSVNGIEGQVSLVGVKAVVAMFIRWSLERHAEKGSVEPSWTLRAVLSFQKDSLLTRESVAKKITVKLNGSEWLLEPLPGKAIKIEENRLIVEGVKLCRLGEPPK